MIYFHEEVAPVPKNKGDDFVLLYSTEETGTIGMNAPIRIENRLVQPDGKMQLDFQKSPWKVVDLQRCPYCNGFG
jgi:hypothetical protein